jgi:hypothetical protein
MDESKQLDKVNRLIQKLSVTPLMHAMRDVPHGSVNYEYYSSVQGTTGTVIKNLLNNILLLLCRKYSSKETYRVLI